MYFRKTAVLFKNRLSDLYMIKKLKSGRQYPPAVEGETGEWN